MTSLNIGNSILIFGTLYLHLVYGLEDFLTIILVLIPLFSWAYHGYTDERKTMFKERIELLKAKTDYYKRKKN